MYKLQTKNYGYSPWLIVAESDSVQKLLQKIPALGGRCADWRIVNAKGRCIRRKRFKW